MTFGIILLALITVNLVPISPIPRRSHSLILHNEALCTVVPSKRTGLNIATGFIELIDTDHSMSTYSVSASSSAHLNAKPPLVS